MTPKTQTRPLVARERALSELAERQHGVVARGQLLGLGFGEGAIEARLGMRRLVALHGGVYAVGQGRVDRRGRWWAGVLAYGGEAMLSHRSAAEFWGLGRQRGSLVEVTAPAGRQGIERRPRLWIHRCRLLP